MCVLMWHCAMLCLQKRDLDRAVEERDALQSKLRTFAMKSEDLTLQVSQANTAKEAADARQVTRPQSPCIALWIWPSMCIPTPPSYLANAACPAHLRVRTLVTVANLASVCVRM